MSRRDCPPVIHLGPTMGVAVRTCVSRLLECLSDADAKVALRAAAELTKLLGVCARNAIRIDAVVPEPIPSPLDHRDVGASEAEDGPTAPARDEPDRDTARESRADAAPARRPDEEPEVTKRPARPIRFEERLSHEAIPPVAQPLSRGYGSPVPSLTSFLNRPPAVNPRPSAPALATG